MAKPAENVRIIEGRKFMWDGRVYEGEEDAGKVEDEYRKNRFDVYRTQEEGKLFLYTRRAAKEDVGKR